MSVWTLYDGSEDVRRASQNNRYIDPEVPLITDMTGNGQIMSLKSTIVDHSWIKMSVRCFYCLLVITIKKPCRR